MSSLSWIDFDARERDQLRQVLALFNQRDTRDELGIGTIRDSIADHLFPGTSTIQTRIRYMLFIPWVYQGLKNSTQSGDYLALEARRRELNITEALLANGETQGVIGKEARENLKRLPSSIYWQGLQTWGIRLFSGSLEEFHQSFQEINQHQIKTLRALKEGEGEGLHFNDWHPNLPRVPDNFPDLATLTLSMEEKEFFIDRLRTSCGESLLTFLSLKGYIDDCDFVWDHKKAPQFPEHIRVLLSHGRNFSEIIHGAALLYNFMLAQKKQSADLIDFYDQEIKSWAFEVKKSITRFQDWDLPRFWEVIEHETHRIPSTTRAFIEGWVAEVLNAQKQIWNNGQARELIRVREKHLKGRQSRFVSSKALENWGGRSGTIRLNYRWPIAKTYIQDLNNAR